MAQKVIALVLGLTVLGFLTAFLLFTKEAEVERATLEFYVGDAPPRDLSSHVLITVDANGEIQLEGQAVDLGALADEIALIVTGAEAAGESVPAFSLESDSAVDNAVIVDVMMAVREGGGTTIAFEPGL